MGSRAEVFACVLHRQRYRGTQLHPCSPCLRMDPRCFAAQVRCRWESAHSDVVNLQRNTLIRVVAFVLGPVLQATKLYACRGIFWTQVLAAIYLGSFFCDEVMLCLLWLTGSTASREGVTGLVEAILSPAVPPTSPKTATFDDDVQEQNEATMPQGLAIILSFLFLLWFAGTAATGICVKHPNMAAWIKVVNVLLGGPASAITFGVLSYRKSSGVLRILKDGALGFAVPVWLSGFLTNIIWNCTPMVEVLENGVVAFHANARPKDWTWKVTGVFSTFGLGLLARHFLANVDRHGIPKPVRVTLTLWAGAHLATALAMYSLAHDPSLTFKPSWTDVLG
ncbi:hypothetical protein CGCSCA4_v007633 [Colletotrichum siamense]|uniref:Uncharacterized protein n=1 Tax=Colletotrichum siamense TaxID=690259 RepID=A0A9P5EQS2_COLSI|nr:hypothetical protein CGCSCA4_v007633 [Colletotrichum siamense]KAF4857724.1 hypothetical protein CGCSCA2_v007996 [Colletotrichum siamense]